MSTENPFDSPPDVATQKIEHPAPDSEAIREVLSNTEALTRGLEQIDREQNAVRENGGRVQERVLGLTESGKLISLDIIQPDSEEHKREVTVRVGSVDALARGEDMDTQTLPYGVMGVANFERNGSGGAFSELGFVSTPDYSRPEDTSEFVPKTDGEFDPSARERIYPIEQLAEFAPAE